MKIKNHVALLAILAISAFLYAVSSPTNIGILGQPAYSPQQLSLLKQLIKKYPSLLQNNTIKSWVAYLEYALCQEVKQKDQAVNIWSF